MGENFTETLSRGAMMAREDLYGVYKFKLHLDIDGAFLQSARMSLEQARQFKLAVDSSQPIGFFAEC